MFFINGQIDKIDLYITNMEKYFYFYLVFYFNYFNTIKNILYIKKLGISQ